MTKPIPISLLSLLLAAPAMPGLAQSPPPRLDYDVPLLTSSGRPGPQLGYQTAPDAMRSGLAGWNRELAQDLLAYIDALGAEGLDPARYDTAALRDAVARDDASAMQAAATPLFLRLTNELSGGTVRGADRVEWYVEGQSLNGHDQQDMMNRALREGRIKPVLDSLLPIHPQYAGLRAALAATPRDNAARRDLIRVNMERWRWMPRDFGARHILVNVPAFTAAIVDDGAVTSRHRVIVGKRATPTPQLSVLATGITFNPWWTLPQSIIREMNGRFAGYEVSRSEGGATIVRQRPGPNNALGRMKIEMANEHAIYLHDTPAKNLFARDVRAFSHGCIRTQDALGFAAILLQASDQWDRAAIDRAVANGRTLTASLPAPIPVHIAYFTAAATDSGDIVTYADLYSRDARVRQALSRSFVEEEVAGAS